MTGTPTIILVTPALLLAGCAAANDWRAVATAEGRWAVWTDEAGNQWRKTLLRYPDGTAREQVEMLEAEK
jgi:hypothetical protein